MDDAFFKRLSQAGRAAVETALGPGLQVDNKAAAGFDPVTEADRGCERALRALIEARYPEDAIWGEEYGWTREGAAREWSLDPVDGTRALVCGLPSWAVLVGVLEGGRYVAGMIDLPWLDERLLAVAGATVRNGVAARVSGCTALAEARFSTTDPFLFAGAEAQAFGRLRQRARLTRYGLDAMAYARVATGDLDLVVESGLKRHDYDALVPVVRGAGGVMGDWEGGEDFGPGRVVAAASRELYEEVVAVLAGA